MDVHRYEKGKYIRTDREVPEPDEVSIPDATGDSTEPELPPTRWPEGSEL
jgi:hypothetical protein